MAERPSTLQDEDVIQQLDQYRNNLHKTIKSRVQEIIRGNVEFLSRFQTGSSSKDILRKTLMDFAAESSNIEEFADMVGDTAMNLPDLNDLNCSVGAISEAREFEDFVKRLLLVFAENLGHCEGGKDGVLIGAVGQIVADYVAELAVDFVRDRVMNEESEDVDDSVI